MWQIVCFVYKLILNPLCCFCFRRETLTCYVNGSLINSRKWQYNKKTTRVPVFSHQTTRVKTYHLSAKLMSSWTRVVWWLRTGTRVIFYSLWIWKYKIVVNNRFLVPTLTYETTIYWRTVSWDSKHRWLRKKIPQWRGQALFQLTNEKWSITTWQSPLYHVVCITSTFMVIQSQVHNTYFKCVSTFLEVSFTQVRVSVTLFTCYWFKIKILWKWNVFY